MSIYTTTFRQDFKNLFFNRGGLCPLRPPCRVAYADMCTIHPTRPLELYCRCEDVLICRDCIIKKHKDHDYDVISDVVDSEKKILRDTLPGIQQLIDEVEGAIDGVKSKRQYVKDREEENLHKLDDAFCTLHAAIDKRKRQLQQQITQDTEGKNKGLAIQEDELCFLLSQLKSCWSFIDDKLQRGVNKDVLAMKRSMLERRDKLKEMKTHIKLYPVDKEQAPINLKGMDKAMHLVSKLGSFCDAHKCFVSDLDEEVPIGKKISFTVILKDALGNEVCSSKELDVLVQYYNKDRVNEAATVREVGAGSYEVSYVPRILKNHTMFVEVGAVPISGSPFELTTLRDYSKIKEENCQPVTHYGNKKFQGPYDIKVATNDDIVIIDEKNKEVIILDKDLNLLRTFGQGSESCKLNYPAGVAVSQNVIAVSDGDDHVVKKFTRQGDYISMFGSNGSRDGQFQNPVGLAFNSKNFLYVVDCDNCRVQIFDSNNNFLFKFGHKGFNSGQFQNPTCIAIDSIDQVYVTDFNCRKGIVVFTEDGHFIKKINCDCPIAICLTPDDYIITSDNYNCLNVFSPTHHQLVTKFGTQGNKQGQFDSIFGVAVDSVGNIFVAEVVNHRLQIITL